MSSLPDTDILCRYGFRECDNLRLSLVGGGFLIISRIGYDGALCKIFCGGELYFYILEGRNRIGISVMVQVDLFYVPDFTEIILEIDVVPSGIAVVITADFLACNDLGIVGIILTA